MASAKVVIKDNSIRLLKINGALSLSELQAAAGNCPGGESCLGDVCFGLPIPPDVDNGNPRCGDPGASPALCFGFTPNPNTGGDTELVPGDFNEDFNDDFLIERAV